MSSRVQTLSRSAVQVDRSEADQVVPGREVVVPDDRRCGSLSAVEHLHVSVRLAEIVPPQSLGSDHRHIHPSYARLARAAVGVDHAVPLAAAGTVPVLTADLAARRAAQRFGTFSDVVADGVTKGGLQDRVVRHLQETSTGAMKSLKLLWCPPLHY